MAILNIYKPLGWTPLEALQEHKALNPGLSDVPMTYAGRLDPMAEGVLILLSAEDVHNKQKFLNLPKTYRAQILFGFSTDSGDLMGLITERGNKTIAKDDLVGALKRFEGRISLRVPHYSSIPVEGKPMFEWTQKNLLHKIKIPRSKTTVYSIELTSLNNISKKDVFQKLEIIKSVKGEFRQNEILEKWEEALAYYNADYAFQAAKIDVNCSSGTYVRSIARELGKKLGTASSLFSLVRTSVGEHLIENSVKLS